MPKREAIYQLCRYGFRVGQKPWYFVTGCLVFSCLCGFGMLNFYQENNAFRLWIAQDSEFVENFNWLQENYPPDTRFNNLIISGSDVLQPEVLQILANIHANVSKNLIAQPDEKNWMDLCKK